MVYLHIIMQNKRKLPKIMLVASVLFWLIWIGFLIVGVNKWLQFESEEVVVSLLSPVSEESTLPVYAQFYVTQTISLPKPVKMTKIEIPVLSSNQNEPLEITVQSGQEIYEKRLLTGTEKLSIWPNFEGNTNSLLIKFAAPNVTVPRKNQAIRLYREKSAAGYKEGEMTIAGIKKDGNINLKVYASMTRYSQLLDRIEKNPAQAAVVLRDLVFLSLLAAWPFALVAYVKEYMK